MDTLWRVIERNAYSYEGQTSLRYPAGNITYTWEQLYRKAAALARDFHTVGVGPGIRIGLYAGNKPEFVLGFLAASALGAVVVPINVHLTGQEISRILSEAQIRFLLYEQSLASVADELAPNGTVIVNITSKLTQGSGESEVKIIPPVPNPDSKSTAEILYTSGTTGNPRGVMLSHEAILSVAKIMSHEAGIYVGYNCLILMPLSHSAPLNLFLWGAFWAGASVTIGEFAPDTLLNFVSQEKTTHFFGAPVVYQLLSRLPNLNRWDLSSMKLWIYGGAPVGSEQIKTWQEALPGKFMCVYGLTEAGPNGSALRPAEHGVKTGSIGRHGTANTEIKVIRTDGAEAGPDEAGELIIRAESLMQGYLGNPEATQETLRDGWLYTGDIARRDADGYIWIMDRKKDMIISGGVNIYPKEIEDILCTHPQIADAAVIGVPHSDWGETVLARVVLRARESLLPDAIREFCRDKLADYKIPRLVEIVDSLPRNASGKLLKHIMRAEWLK